LNANEELLAIEHIRQLKARYFRCIDTKDWEGFRQVFAPDVVMDISQDVPGCILTDREKVVAMVSAGLTGCVSVHHGHCPEIEITSDTTAKGIWAMEDKLRWAAADAPITALHGYGHYIESYERIAGRWHIKTLKLSRLRVDVDKQQ
jgi:hypothetical protein